MGMLNDIYNDTKLYGKVECLTTAENMRRQVIHAYLKECEDNGNLSPSVLDICKRANVTAAKTIIRDLSKMKESGLIEVDLDAIEERADGIQQEGLIKIIKGD